MGKAAGLAEPSSRVDGAAEHNRAIPVDARDLSDRDCLGVDSTLGEPGGNRLGDLMGATVAGGCGNETFTGALLNLSGRRVVPRRANRAA